MTTANGDANIQDSKRVALEATTPGNPPINIWKSLMQNLIYPAVLGTVIYTALQTSLASLPPWTLIRTFNFPPWDRVLLLKLLILAITVTFYCFDFLYLMFSNRFGPLFFTMDIVFLVTLYRTSQLLNFGSTTLPKFRDIIICYFIFLALYLLWDALEYNQLEDGGERQLFWRVMKWEGVSLLILGVAVAFAGGRCAIVVTPLALAIVTGWFGILAVEKRLYVSPETVRTPFAK